MKNLILKVGQNHTFSQIMHDLIDFGYEKTEKVDLPAQFAQLGGLLKIFPVNLSVPVMVEFFGNNVEQIYLSDETGKKIERLESIIIDSNILILPDKVKINRDSFVVHDDHGVGQFAYIQNKKVSDEIIQYVVLRYLNNDLLYVPMNQIEKISPYIGVGHRHPKLSRLGSVSWKKTYKKTYEDIIQVARELLNVYAHRQIVHKKPRQIFTDWNGEIKSSFGFTETEDQEKAIRDVYSDLTKDIPMDRLICGDVGFGKTEVALRAIGQTIANGYQAALLVPTTILAEQHFSTLSNRLKNLPVRVERVSRFICSSDCDEILSRVEKGQVDLLIGTHKLLRDKVSFRKLGLLVIDEEQKFGVKDKEHLKKMQAEIDVLTLTATPIPRTLFMSLSGIRDISQISSIPTGRQAIKTAVAKFDESMINSYIERETKSGGQVYFLHNEVETIGGIRNHLQKQFPNLIIEVGHGQMPELQLAKTMRSFADGKIDILVCSTIIENGLDLPNVNTLIVDNSDHFGLSQLYQIRGRIGRSKKQAYALFTYSAKKLTDNAVKRLRAIAENTELGTGYSIALSDLEIRGGGNILGKKQHGNMEAVGLVLYSKMLKIAVDKIKKIEF